MNASRNRPGWLASLDDVNSRPRYPARYPKSMWPFTRQKSIHSLMAMPEQNWSPPLRTRAVVSGCSDLQWPEVEEINPDHPSMCPYIHDLCVRMPTHWDFESITHNSGDIHDALFSRDGVYYSFHVGPFEDGVMLELDTTRNAELATVRQFLLDIDKVLQELEGNVLWYPDAIMDSGCLIMNYQALSADSPIVPIPNIG